MDTSWPWSSDPPCSIAGGRGWGVTVEGQPSEEPSRSAVGGAAGLPARLAESFSEGELGDGAVATYLDSGAADPLLEVAEDVDGVVVDGTTAVLLARSTLTPDRARELSSTLSRFLGEASPPGEAGLRPAGFPDR